MSETRNHQEPVYHIPPGLRVYAIGDIHGDARALDAMHEAISVDLLEQPPEEVHIVYLGDYVDRGPDTSGVLDRLIQRRDRKDGIRKSFLMGNHENGMMDFMRDPGSKFGMLWPQYGGIEALASYGITFEGGVPLPGELERASGILARVLPEAHLEFLQRLEMYVEIGDYMFVHAGRHPQKRLEDHEPRDLYFIREPFLSWHLHPEYRPFGKKVVHGHSVTETKKPEIYPHRINIDTGNYQGGPLSAAVLEGSSVRFLMV